jgi:hypothetical protein
MAKEYEEIAKTEHLKPIEVPPPTATVYHPPLFFARSTGGVKDVKREA